MGWQVADRWRAGAMPGLMSVSLRVLTIKMAAAALGFVVTLAIARWYGPAELGIYSFTIAIASLIAVPCFFGTEPLAIREVQRFLVRHAHGHIQGMIRWVIGMPFILSLVVGGAFSLVFRALAPPPTAVTAAFDLMLLLLPALVLNRVIATTVRGLGHVPTGHVLDSLLRPLFLLLSITIVVFVAQQPAAAHQAPRILVMLAGAAAAAAALSAAVVLLLKLPSAVRRAKPAYVPGAWLRASLILMVEGSAIILFQRTDLVLLGMLTDAPTVGLYRVPSQFMLVIGFGLAAVNAGLRPMVVAAHAAGDRGRLQHVASSGAVVGLALTSPPVLVCVVAAPQLMILFGSEFVAAAPALVILAVAFWITAWLGSPGLMLNMTGHETRALRASLFGIAVNAGLNLVLIPPFGIMGAAAATGVSLVLWRLAMVVQVWRLLATDPTIRAPLLHLYRRSRSAGTASRRTGRAREAAVDP